MQFRVGSTFGDEEDGYALARQLKNRNSAVRRASAEAIAAYGAKSRSVLDDLKAAANDSDEAVRSVVRDAIAAMEKDQSK